MKKRVSSIILVCIMLIGTFVAVLATNQDTVNYDNTVNFQEVSEIDERIISLMELMLEESVRYSRVVESSVIDFEPFGTPCRSGGGVPCSFTRWTFIQNIFSHASNCPNGTCVFARGYESNCDWACGNWSTRLGPASQINCRVARQTFR
ncbi:MAG: hypothetical protein FWE05_13570 [Defluviitaleaceae bacterium]|nr:hypothetical protein [Defluviitaleaceae bacterium]